MQDEETGVRNGGREGNLQPDEFTDYTSYKFWSLYCSKADTHDKNVMGTWKDDMDSILIFSGLFSAVVTAFIIESYKGLEPDKGDITIALLAQMSHQLAAMSNASHPSVPLTFPETASFSPAPSVFKNNLLWFLSLSFSLAAAFNATLVKQWLGYYFLRVQRNSDHKTRGREHIYLRRGIQNSGMALVITALPGMLHISLFLFWGGLYEFLRPINGIIAKLVFAGLLLGASMYAVTILSTISRSSPYQGPFSLSNVTSAIRYGFHLIVSYVFRRYTARHYHKEWLLKRHAARRRRDVDALRWMSMNVGYGLEATAFIESLPQFLRSLPASQLHKACWQLLYCIDRLIFNSADVDEQHRRTTISFSALCVYFDLLSSASPRYRVCSELPIVPKIVRDIPSPARCTIAAVACLRFRNLEGSSVFLLIFAREELEVLVQKCREISAPRSARHWEIVLDQFTQHTNLVREFIKTIRLLALIDFLIALMESPSIPNEALQSIPNIVPNIDASSQDPSLQLLLVDVVHEVSQWNQPLPAVSSQDLIVDTVRRRDSAPAPDNLTVIDQLLPILSTLSDRVAIDKAEKVIRPQKSDSAVTQISTLLQ